MMKQATALLIIALLLGSTAEAQKSKKTTPQKRPPAKSQTRPRTVAKDTPKPNAPRVIGTTVIVTTKNGDQIKGELLDLSAYSVKIRADKLESTLALESLSAISFDSTAVPGVMNDRPEDKPSSNPEEFARDARTVLSALDGMPTSSLDYTEYGRILSELRSKVEFFVQKYGTTENLTEARIVALTGGAMTDYAWSRTVWTLKLGRSSNNTVEENDSPIIADALTIYPELRAANVGGTKYAADKLINGLWKRAVEKTSRARALLK
jgi:hypothetical protein